AAIKLMPDERSKDIKIEIERPRRASEHMPGTVLQGAMTCPRCGFTTAKDRVRAQLAERHGGAAEGCLVAVVEPAATGVGRDYRLPEKWDIEGTISAASELSKLVASASEDFLLPDELMPAERVWKNNPIRVHLYGVRRWLDLFSPRQQLLLGTYSHLVRHVL